MNFFTVIGIEFVVIWNAFFLTNYLVIDNFISKKLLRCIVGIQIFSILILIVGIFSPIIEIADMTNTCSNCTIDYNYVKCLEIEKGSRNCNVNTIVMCHKKMLS